MLGDNTILDCRFWIGDCCDGVVMRSDERAHAACSIPIGISQSEERALRDLFEKIAPRAGAGAAGETGRSDHQIQAESTSPTMQSAMPRGASHSDIERLNGRRVFQSCRLRCYIEIQIGPRDEHCPAGDNEKFNRIAVAYSQRLPAQCTDAPSKTSGDVCYREEQTRQDRLIRHALFLCGIRLYWRRTLDIVTSRWKITEQLAPVESIQQIISNCHTISIYHHIAARD